VAWERRAERSLRLRSPASHKHYFDAFTADAHLVASFLAVRVQMQCSRCVIVRYSSQAKKLQHFEERVCLHPFQLNVPCFFFAVAEHETIETTSANNFI